MEPNLLEGHTKRYIEKKKVASKATKIRKSRTNSTQELYMMAFARLWLTRPGVRRPTIVLAECIRATPSLLCTQLLSTNPEDEQVI